MRAGVYVRISRTDGADDTRGVDRHEEECRALCERKNWEVVGVYTDNDTSATNGKARPAYERMLADVAAREIDAIVAWHPDRLHRSPKELERFLDVIEQAGVGVETAKAGAWDFTPTGKLGIRMLGNIAKYEVEHKAERQRSANVQSAKSGSVNGGGRRPFGYAPDRVTIVEAEAEIVREMARRLLAGESQNSIARDLALRGIATTAGNPWVPLSIRQAMATARISGRREHHGEIVGKAVWPGIVSVEDSDRLRALLARPVERVEAAPRTYLLSGLLICDKCKHPLVGRRKGVTPRYICRRIPGTDRCGGTVTNAQRTDVHMRDLVLAALTTPELREARQARRHADPALFTSVEQDRQQLDELAEMWANRELSRAEWQRARATVQARLTANERQLARATLPDPLDDFLGSYDQMRDSWEQMANLSRRVILDAVVEQVVVGAAKPKQGAKSHWDAERFTVTWRP